MPVPEGGRREGEDTVDRKAFYRLMAALARGPLRVKVKIVGLNQRLTLTLSEGCPCCLYPWVSQILVHHPPPKKSHNSIAPVSFPSMWGVGSCFLCSFCSVCIESLNKKQFQLLSLAKSLTPQSTFFPKCADIFRK